MDQQASVSTSTASTPAEGQQNGIDPGSQSKGKPGGKSGGKSGAKPGGGMIDQLTSLRFLAAFGVVLYHLRLYFPDGLIRRSAANMNMGVIFFFVLSGFILTINYVPRGKIDLRDFYVARIARIYPAYLFSMFVVAMPLFFALIARYGGLEYALKIVGLGTPAVLLFVQDMVPGPLSGWNGPAWTLACEVFFYALFPFLAPLLFSKSMPRALMTMAGLWLLALAFFYAGYPIRDALAAGGSKETWQTVEHIRTTFPVAYLPVLALGIPTAAVYLLIKDRPSARWVGSWATTIVLCGCLVAVQNFGLLDFEFGRRLLDLIFAGLILSMALNPRPGLLVNPTLILLGEASYSLYILHAPLIRGIEFVLHESSGGARQSLAIALISVVVVIAGSIFSYRVIEVPGRRLIRARLERRKAKAAPAPAT